MHYALQESTAVSVIDRAICLYTIGSKYVCFDSRLQQCVNCGICNQSSISSTVMFRSVECYQTANPLCCGTCTMQLIASAFYKTGQVARIHNGEGTKVIDVTDHMAISHHNATRYLSHDQFVFTDLRHRLGHLLDPINRHHLRIALMREFIGIDIGWCIARIYINHHMVGLAR